MYAYEAIASALAAEGVELAFGLLGSDIYDLAAEMVEKWGMKFINNRNEHGAAAMADGYARVRGTPGVCMVTSGPGLTNAATALTTAYNRRSPVLCIVGETARTVRRDNKTMDQRRVAEATAGAFFPVRHRDTIGEDVQLAFRHIRSGHGPAVLSVPRDIMYGELEKEWDYHPSSEVMPPPHRLHPDPSLVAWAASILAEAERPVILIGRGAVVSEAGEEIEALAEKMGALLTTSLQGRGYLGDHPFHVGIAGGYATDVGQSLLTEADCVIGVGASLNMHTTDSGLLFPGARFIHIDTDPGRIGDTTPVALGIVGDAQATVAALNHHMEAEGFAQKKGFWNADVRETIAAARMKQEVSYVQAPDTIDPRQLVAEIDKVLPKNRIVVTDGGHFKSFVAPIISLPDPLSLVWTLDIGSIGMGLPISIGAALGRPDRHVVAFLGDGGFMMGTEELDTAVRHRIPITVVVMNDNSFGAEVHYAEQRELPYSFVLFDNPELAELARALGATGLTVRGVEDLDTVAEYVGKGDRPVLIDAKINRSVVHKIL